jgi:serine/threonine-protein kinase SRPK3
MEANIVQNALRGNGSTRTQDSPSRDVQPISLENVEDIYKYGRGGYHPTRLGDVFHNERYKVIHKLGSGGFSIVWLARDRRDKRYVALKILIAKASKNYLSEVEVLSYLQERPSPHPGRTHISFLLDRFWINGVSGSHLCLVYDVTGPAIGHLDFQGNRLRGHVARNVGKQLVQAIAYLHSEGICHGDITPRNLTLEISGLDEWTEADVQERFGAPKMKYLRTYSGNSVPCTFPDYVVEPADMSNLGPRWQTSKFCLIDFGESFFTDKPPKVLGMPSQFFSPSDWFERTPNKGSDLWALGCTLFNLRSGGMDLVDTFWGASSVHCIREIQDFLEPLPERWDRLYFNEYDRPASRDELTPERRAIFDEEKLEPWSKESPRHDLWKLASSIKDDYHGPPRPEDLESAQEDDCDDSNLDLGDSDLNEMERPMIGIPAEEADCLSDLLVGLLRYEPTERTAAEALIDHPWFTREFPENKAAEDAPPLFQSIPIKPKESLMSRLGID